MDNPSVGNELDSTSLHKLKSTIDVKEKRTFIDIINTFFHYASLEA